MLRCDHTLSLRYSIGTFWDSKHYLSFPHFRAKNIIRLLTYLQKLLALHKLIGVNKKPHKFT